MKRIILCIGLIFLLSSHAICDEQKFKIGSGRREVVDKIVARVNGSNILLSDLQLPRIDLGGAPYTIEQAIEHELLFQKAVDRKLLPTALDVEKYILSWKRENNLINMSDAEFEERIHAEGLSLKQYRNQLARILAIRNLRGLEMSERVVVTSAEIEAYFKANPEYSDDEYLLQTKIVPAARAESEDAALKEAKKIKWIELDWVKKSNLASKMSFVSSMKVGEVSKPLKVEQGYQFLKLVKKITGHLETFEERYVKIERTLQDEKLQKFEREYVANLREDPKTSIVYM